MSAKKEPDPPVSAHLRKRAEELLADYVRDVKAPSYEDVQDLVHELQVYQFELEMQNEELCQSRQELEESQEELSDLYDLAPVGYVTLDGQGIVRKANLTTASMLGIERQRLNDRTFAAYVAKPDRPAFGQHVRACIKRGQKQTVELRLCAQGGRVFPVELRWVPVEDDDGSIASCRVAIMDISQRVQANQELVLREHAMSACAEGISITDPSQADNPLVYVNEGFERITGYSREEVLGRNMRFLQGPKTDPHTVAGFHEAVGAGRPATIEIENHRKDGSPFWNRVAITPVKDAAGQITRFIAVHSDITRQKLQESRTSLVVDVLEHLNRDGSQRAAMRGILQRVKDHTGFAAVGIRLREGQDFPYFETNGLPDKFVEKERYLCARDPSGKILCDAQGSPVLECMCGNVLCGSTDPSLPFFTPGGSFWTNSTSGLLASTTEEARQGLTRNRCHGAGYESVALIPVRSDGDIIGLLQLNDPQPNRLTLNQVEFLEGVASSIGIAMHKAEAVAAVERSAAEWQNTFDASGDSIMILDKDRRIMRANRCATELTGLPVAEMQGKTCCELIHRTDVPPDTCPLGQMMETGERAAVELELPQKGIWKSIVVDPLFGANGELVGAVHVCRDITDQKLAEVALYDHLNFLSTLIDTIPSPVFYKDMAGRYTGCNPAFKEYLGMPKEQIIGRTARELAPPELAAQYHRMDEALLALGRGGTQVYESVVQKGGGTVGQVVFNKASYLDAQGEVAGIVGVIQDITNLRETENNLRKREAELAHVARVASMGEMVATIAHEINQPLHAITNYANGAVLRLRAGKADPDLLMKAMEQTVAEAHRASETIRRLWRMLQRHKVRPSTVSINDVVRDCVAIAQQDLDDKGVEIHLELAESLPSVIADSIQVEQVLFNLVRNAQEAMTDTPAGSRHLTISTSRNDAELVEVWVQDTGPGIDPEAMARLFDPFFTTKSDGLGMGLAICHFLIEAHRGKLWAEAGSPRGAVFRFMLPISTKEEDHE